MGTARGTLGIEDLVRVPDLNLGSSSQIDPAVRLGHGLVFDEQFHVAEIAIPGNFLTEGTMLVNTAIRQWQPAQTLEYFVPEAIAFQVIDSLEGDSARGHYPGDLAGVVRPKLEWRTELTGSKDGH